jgi:hypothetical protein
MQASNHIIDELLEISPLLSRLDRTVPLYRVPEGYFNAVPQQILQRIYQKSGEVPEGYFENFASAMMDRIRTLETAAAGAETTGTEVAYPLLAGISRKTPYAVPDGYFSQFPGQVAAAVLPVNQPARLVSFGKWVRFAVAAAVAGIIVSIVFFNGGNHQNPDALTALSKVSDQEIVNYLQEHDIPITDAGAKSMAVNDFNDNDIKDLLSNVSDNELEQYSNDISSSQQPKTN